MRNALSDLIAKSMGTSTRRSDLQLYARACEEQTKIVHSPAAKIRLALPRSIRIGTSLLLTKSSQAHFKLISVNGESCRAGRLARRLGNSSANSEMEGTAGDSNCWWRDPAPR